MKLIDKSTKLYGGNFETKFVTFKEKGHEP